MLGTWHNEHPKVRFFITTFLPLKYFHRLFLERLNNPSFLHVDSFVKLFLYLLKIDVNALKQLDSSFIGVVNSVKLSLSLSLSLSFACLYLIATLYSTQSRLWTKNYPIHSSAL